MNLTALDAETDAVIFPFDEGRTRGRCRDEDCRAEMIAVHAHEAVDDGATVTLRRAHWRHKIAPDGSRRCAGDRRYKTAWHEDWQMRCADAERIEARTIRGQQVRIADVMTRFSWVVEFQHSVIKSATAKARETHYRGKVLWIVDGTPQSSVNGVVDVYQGNLRWHQVREWVIEAKTLVGVDDGDNVHLLPPGGLRKYLLADELSIPLSLVRTYGHDEFADLWLNGDTLPLPVNPNTEWAQLAAERAAKSRDRAASDARLRANSARRAQYDPDADVCRYQGSRERLVYDEGTPTKTLAIGKWSGVVRMCGHDGCISAAGPSGRCWAHQVANDIGFDSRMGIAV